MYRQIQHGKYPPDFLYGDGNAGERIAQILRTIDLDAISIQKRFCDKSLVLDAKFAS